MIDHFISYAREDLQIAQQIVQRLNGEGRTTWIDEKDIPPSVPWMTEIQRAIDDSLMVIVIESSHWLASDACRIEADLADQGRVPVLRVGHDYSLIDETLAKIATARLELHPSREAAVVAATSASIWTTAGRKKSLLSRGRPLRQLRTSLKQWPDAFSESATAFIGASSRASTRRWVTGFVLGLVAPILIVSIQISNAFSTKVDQEITDRVVASARFAERDMQEEWNFYSGLENSPADVSDSYTAYYQLFRYLGERTPSEWDSTPSTVIGSTTASSPDGKRTAGDVEGSRVRVTGPDGAPRSFLASAPITSLAWSPDSQWIAASTTSGADVISAETGQIITLRGGAGSASSVIWSDDTHVAVGGSAGTGIWEVFDGDRLAALDGVRYGTAVGATLYTVDELGTLTATDTESGATTVIPLDIPEGGRPTAIDSTPEQVIIAYDSEQPQLSIVNVSSGTSRNLPLGECLAVSMSVLPDGSVAYLACSQSSINRTRVDLITGAIDSQPMQTQMSLGVRVLDDRVLWGGQHGGVFQSTLDLSPREPLTDIAGCGAAIRKFVGPSSGDQLFQIGDATGSFNCATRISIQDDDVVVNRLIFEADDGHAVPDAAMSPDGSLIAYGLADGRVRVFTTDGFIPVYFAQVMPDQVRAIAFSPDGTALIVAGATGTITSIPISFESMSEASSALTEDATTRLENAMDWGLYTPTAAPRE